MRTLVTAVAALVLCAGVPSAQAAEAGWRQDDWSGGPNQALFQDASRYDSSSRVDSMGVGGVLRLSRLCGTFTKDPSNPILPKGGAGAWDEKYILGSPRQREGGGYEILYTGMDAANVYSVGYADSGDGVTWAKRAGNPVLRGSGTEAWDQNGVSAESLVRDGGTWHCYFRGEKALSNDYSYGHATSSDLVAWSRGKNPVLSPGGPGAWDSGGIRKVAAIKSGAQFHIWYLACAAGGTGRIGHATSADGETWAKDPLNAVLDVGLPGSFDDVSILDFQVIERPWVGGYLMAYTASTLTPVQTFSIGIASSPDGSHWTKDAGNPVLSTGGVGWFADFITVELLSFDGSVYTMLLSGADGANLERSGEAWSEDGSAWQENFANPLLSPGGAGAWDSAAAAITSVYPEGNVLRAFYRGFPPLPCYTVGTATAAASYNAAGTLTSSVFDAGVPADWKSVKWHEEKPAGTDVAVEVRCGNTAAPDGSWTPWAQVSNGGQNPHADTRYMQYRVTLSTAVPASTPEFRGIAFNLPIDLTPNKYAFSTSDTLSVAADVEPISTPCYPFVRVLMADGSTLYYERGKGFTASPTPYLGFKGGPMTVGAAIAGYPVLSAAFSGIPAGTYVLEGGAVDMTRTTSASSLYYVNPIDRELLYVQ